MIGLDTNVLVRYIMQDDAMQSAKACALLETLTADTPGLVPVVAVVELVWVLGSCHSLDRARISAVLDGLLRTRELVVEHAEIVWQALRSYRSSKADFAECLIERCAAAAGCEHTLTFDRGAAQHAGMRLIA